MSKAIKFLGGRKYTVCTGVITAFVVLRLIGAVGEETLAVVTLGALGIYGGGNVGAAMAYFRGKAGGK